VLINKKKLLTTTKNKIKKSKNKYRLRYLISQDEIFFRLYLLNLFIKIIFYSIKQ